MHGRSSVEKSRKQRAFGKVYHWFRKLYRFSVVFSQTVCYNNGENQKAKGDQTMANKSMGEIISTLRKEKGMTQKELADRLSITDKAVSKWEREVSRS